MNIIIVDDELVSLTVLKQLVEKLPDCCAQGFTDASAALVHCEQNDPDLVLVDYMMPNAPRPVSRDELYSLLKSVW